MVAYSGSGIETTFTQGEDSCLAELVRSCRRRPDRRAPQLLVAGTLSDVVEDQFQRLFDELGIGPGGFLPARSAADAPPVGPGTRVLLAQPYLTETVAALTNAAPSLLAAPFPLGPRARAPGCGGGRGLGCDPESTSTRSPPRRWPAPSAPSPHSVKSCRSSASASCPDSQLELPWRASCSASAACR
jgi:light-independent protochlorophyllide reductase subunit N